MILIGQYDSPFVRRVGIALTLYGLPFDHRPWSVFGDADKIAPINPLVRVPTLVLASGEVLVDSTTILDHLDDHMPEGDRLFPASGPARRQALRIASLATGLADKAVSLFYERRLHPVISELWQSRCIRQIDGVLSALEAECRPAPFWFGAQITHADIALGCALRFLTEAHPGQFPLPAALTAHAAHLESLPAFQTILQPFAAPA